VAGVKLLELLKKHRSRRGCTPTVEADAERILLIPGTSSVAHLEAAYASAAGTRLSTTVEVCRGID
jgi:hypothetical protein